MPVDVDSRLELLRTERPQNVDSPIWPESQKRLMEQIVEEHQRRDELLRAGLTPTTTVLFSGPPGVGKTLSARWLSSELKVPLHTLDLSAVMSSFLGRTGNNLRNVLDYARGTECVLLLDEFDAIAKRRDDATEIGELKRLVTVLLQEIDTWPNVGLLIAATNHAELLDPAVWRRFDSVVHFQLPSKPDLESFLKRLFIEHPISEEMTSAVSSAYLGMSFSDLERDAERVRREAVMGGGDVQTLLLSLVKEQATRLRPKERKAL
ncbi:MAG: AAA family ATPase, partial [Planctomycetaceae bacterium]|nr:AAA family ATPase [Planctomycetaceae bacterium]